ncbi:MAG: branched-chain amino acid ABC transporter permease [Lentisphaerae bacterium RIFOXYC12_FULL_60_16]|nr:MAG: branched-chain amino acid ABC transporter permease [Lentisphaerae bacterium RIFOXYC12_FULL_60_16]
MNLIAGFAGLLSVAQAGFYGVGAYVAAFLALQFHTPFVLNLTVSAVVAGGLGFVVGGPSLRLRGDYLVIATFSFQVIVLGVFTNWTSVTGGPMGLYGIPPVHVLGSAITSPLGFLVLVAATAAIVLWIASRLARPPFVRTPKAIREDHVLAAVRGKNVARTKLSLFVVSSAMAAVAGVLNTYYMRFIDPSSFTVMESIFIITIVIVGGAGNLYGPIVGAVVLVLLPEILRLMGIPSAAAANIRQILYGLALVACMLWRPQGLIGEYAFGREATPK